MLRSRTGALRKSRSLSDLAQKFERFMTEQPLLTVTELTRRLKDLVEGSFPHVWVQGEISSCTRAGSGHIYLTLKDEASQLRAVLWRSAASRLKFDVHDGLDVIAAGPLEVYQARGTYQLIVEQLIPQGIGALELAFRQLQENLSAEGLFDQDRKRSLPRFPKRIALVTSPTGAAVRDMLQVISRRWQAADVVLIPVPVQGAVAAEEIAVALETAPRLANVDVIITGRGGGSLEDLWAFNEERVARAIFASPVPVISAVGHEIDVTIADLVADLRALTPSEAAELVVPNRREILADVKRTRDRLCAALSDQADRARLRLDRLAASRSFTRPLRRIHETVARLDETSDKLRRAIGRRIQQSEQEVANLARSLETLSPLNVLERGYSVTQRAETGEIVRNGHQLKPGEKIRTRFADGGVISSVESVE